MTVPNLMSKVFFYQDLRREATMCPPPPRHDQKKILRGRYGADRVKLVRLIHKKKMFFIMLFVSQKSKIG